MSNIKHVGRLKNTGAKVVVVFRTLPGESDHCLVVPTSQMPDAQHDAFIELLETPVSQEAFEFGEVLFRNYFPDGRQMLNALRVENRLHKVATNGVIMTPNNNANIPLDELNVMIAEQKNCSVDDLCTFVQGAPKSGSSVKNAAEISEPAPVQETQATVPADTLVADSNAFLSDEDLAKSYRSQADALYKEAARLRREAETLDPTKKTTKKATEEA